MKDREDYLRAACAAFMACANMGLSVKPVAAKGVFVVLESGDEYSLFYFFAPISPNGLHRTPVGYGEKLSQVLAAGYVDESNVGTLLGEFDGWMNGRLRGASEEAMRLDYEDYGLQHVCAAFDAAWSGRQRKDAA